MTKLAHMAIDAALKNEGQVLEVYVPSDLTQPRSSRPHTLRFTKQYRGWGKPGGMWSVAESRDEVYNTPRDQGTKYQVHEIWVQDEDTLVPAPWRDDSCGVENPLVPGMKCTRGANPHRMPHTWNPNRLSSKDYVNWRERADGTIFIYCPTSKSIADEEDKVRDAKLMYYEWIMEHVL